MEGVEKILIPDIGGAQDVDVIEVLVQPGDTVSVDDPLITLEGDKATMEVPSPLAGTVTQMVIKKGDKVSAGDLILELKTQANQGNQPATEMPSAAESLTPTQTSHTGTEQRQVTDKPTAQSAEKTPSQPGATSGQELAALQNKKTATILAGPAARRLAREVDIDLAQIPASGEKGRVTKADVQAYIKQRMAGSSGTGGMGFNLPQMPAIDFSQFGAIERQSLSKIKKISGASLHRNWVSIPHVTQFDETDITEMETFRQQQRHSAEKQGYKLTPLVFIMKAVVAALKQFPHFNASLEPDGTLVLKKYFHIGVAVDTPHGLVVPVIRQVDQKGISELAKELAAISQKVRDTGLALADMQGGCFTISSLGGIGGTAFTPIINAPEVAILGVSKASTKPVYQNGQWVPRLMLPLSLSYDHRVIDGADAARFIVYLNQCLSDIRTLLL